VKLPQGASRARRTPRVATKKAYHHGDLRRQLVRAAYRLVKRDGHAHFRVAEACKLAGVSTAAPYKHFEDREAILEAVATEGFGRLRDGMLSRLDGVAPGSRAAITAIGHGYVGFALTEPHVFRLMFGGDPSGTVHDPDHPDDAEQRSPFEVLTRHVGLFLELDADAPGTQRSALALWTFVHGLAALQIEEKLGVTTATVEGMVEMAAERLLPAFD